MKNRLLLPRGAALCLAASILGALSAAFGAVIYWDGTATGWNVVGSWSTVSGATTPDPTAVPGAADVATWATQTTAQTVNLNAAQSALGLSWLAANTGTTTLLGGGTNQTLTLGSSGFLVASGAGAVTIGSATAGQNVNVALGANQTWQNDSANALTVNNIVSGAFGITKTGTGALVLNGVNTYTGINTINAGSVRATVAAALGASTAANAVSLGGGTLVLGNDTATTFGRNVTVTANSTITADRATSAAPTVTHTLTNLSIGAQTLTVNRGANITGTAIGGVTFSGTTTLTGAAIFDPLTTSTLTLTGIVSGANTLTKGAGLATATGTLVLNGANTYTGVTTVNGGALQIGNASALGTNAAVNLLAVANANASTLNLSGGLSFGSGKTLTMNTNTSGDLRSLLGNVSGSNTWGGAISVVGTGVAAASNSVAATNLTVSGNLTSTGGSTTGTFLARGTSNVIFNGNITFGTDRSFTHTDSGTAIINTTGNTWRATQISDGQLQLGITNALDPTVDLIIGQAASTTNGRWELNGFNQTVAALRTFSTSTGTTHVIRNSNVLAPSTLTFSNSAAEVLKNTQILGIGVLNLVKNGLGRFDFQDDLMNNANITFNAGTLGFNASTATTLMSVKPNLTGAAAATLDKAGPGTVSLLGNLTQPGPVTVSAGTLIVGGGTSGNVTVATGASLGAGNNYGTLASGAVTFGTGATGFKPVLGFPGIIAVAATSLTANGATTITPSGAGISVGRYPLITYGGAIGGGGFGAFSLGAVGSYPHITAGLVNNTGSLDLDVTVADTLTWTGATNATWDVNLTQNFKIDATSAPANFFTSDSVTFDDTGANKAITVSGTPQIGNLFFNNSAGNDFTLTGVLAGAGSIIKTNTGALTLASANQFTGVIDVGGGTLNLNAANLSHGAVTVQVGTLKIGNSNAISSGALVTVSNGGTIDMNGQAIGNVIPEVHFAGAGVGGLGAITSTGASLVNLSHFGKVVMDDDASWGSAVRYDLPNTVQFVGNGKTFTKVGVGETWFYPTIVSQPGAVVVNGGTLGVQTANPLGASVNVTVNTGAFHSIFSAINLQHQVILNDGGTFRSISGAPLMNGNVTINDNPTSNHFLTAAASQTLNVIGKVTGQGGFTHNGGGTLTLQNATNDYLGDTLLTSGTLSFANGGQIPSTTNLIVSGGTFATGGINRTVANLSGTGGTISGGAFLTVNQTTNQVWGGVLSATTLTKAGAGTLTLSGTADNAGGIVIANVGMVVLGKSHTAALAEHAVGSGLTINSGATVQLGGLSVGPFTGTVINLAPTGAVVGPYVDQIYNNLTVNLNTGGTLDLAGKSESVQGLLGGGTVTNSTAATNSRLYLGSAGGTNVNGTFAGVIQDGGGVVEIEKLGGSTFTLTGANTYSGATVVTGGLLTNNGTLGNTAVTVATGATFISNGALTGSATANTGGVANLNATIGNATANGGTLNLNAAATNVTASNSGVVNTTAATSVSGTTTLNTSGVLNVGGNTNGAATGTLNTGSLTFAGSTLNVDFTGTATDLINSSVSNGVTINGSNPVNILVGPSGWLTGTFPLINYTGTVQGTGASALTLSGTAGHSTASIVDNLTGTINLQVTGAGNSIWKGNVNSTWDTNATLNWTSTDFKFLAGDVAQLDDTAVSFTPSIATNVTPAATLFNNSTNNYTLSGAAGVAGAGGLTKQGTGTVTLLNPNTYTGNTSVQGGTLVANYNNGAAVTVLATAGTVQVSSGATFRAIANDAAFTLANPLSGAGTVELNAHAISGTATAQSITLSGASNAFSGTLRLAAPVTGTYRVAPTGPVALGTAALDVKTGAQLFLAAGTYTNALTIAGTGYADTSGNIGALRFEGSTWAGNIIVDAAGARIGAHGGTGTVTGNISGGPLTVNATNYNTTNYTIVLTGSNSYTTTIIGGAATAGTGTNTMRLNIGANGTTGTLGSGPVTLNGDGMIGLLAFDHSDSYSLLTGQTITGAGTTISRTFLEFDVQGSGFSSNGNNLTLGAPALGGTIRVGYNRPNTTTNINAGLTATTLLVAGISTGLNSTLNLQSGANVSVANISVGGGAGVAATVSPTLATINIAPGATVAATGNFFLGDQTGFMGVVNQTGGGVTLGTQLRIAHWPNNTSTYNISGAGTLSVTANAALVTNPSGGAEQNGGIYLGIDGTGIMNQSGNSIVTTDWVVLDNRVETLAGVNQADGIDRYNLGGGTLEIRGQFGIQSRNASTEFNFTGGTIKNVGTGVNMAIAPGGGTGAGNFIIGTGGTGTPTLDTNGATNSITVTRAFTGAGTLAKAGAGTLSMNIAHPAWTGNFDINGGIVSTNAANGGLGSFTTAGRVITLNGSSTVNLTSNNILGNGVGNANLPTVTINAGSTLNSTRYNALGNVNLNGGTLAQTSTDTGSYQGYQLRGNVAVGGSAVSAISTGNGKGTHLGASTTFTVADAISGSATDLVVSTPLLDQSADYGGSGSFTKAGSGTMSLTALSTYTGATNITGGTLLLGINNALPATAPLNLSTGATLNAGGFSNTTGTLSVNGASIIDTTTSTSVLTFTDANTWTGMLSVWYYTGAPWTAGTDKIIVTNQANVNYANINFYSDNGITQIGTGGGGMLGNELVPVPEASGVFSALGLLGLLGYRERRRFLHYRK